MAGDGDMTGGSRTRVRGAVVAVTLVALCAPASQVAAADDAGVGSFFRDIFGGAEPASVPPQQPFYDLPQDRPVIVRRKRSHTASHRPEAKIAVGPVAPVSIYEDRTLKPGDAVMTKTGVRIFLGGRGLPYDESNFAALSEADGLPRLVQKELTFIDKAPRS